MEPDRPLSYRALRTEDGSPTLVHPLFGEAYSSCHGAWMQANELYLKLTQTHQHPAPRVLEIGFGLGVNFRAALENCLQRGVFLEFLSYEFLPVSREVLASVEVPLSTQARPVWEELLTNWPTSFEAPLVLQGAWGRLGVCFEDVLGAKFPARWASAVYLDPFSPEVNPEPWQLPVLQQLFTAMQPGGYLATYSVAGQIRRSLQAVGFCVDKVPGVGKRAWTKARRP